MSSLIGIKSERHQRKTTTGQFDDSYTSEHFHEDYAQDGEGADCLCINPYNLLQKSIFLALRSVEFVAKIRVISILHIAVTLPHRYLSGCADKLAGDNFCVLDMNSIIDSVERVMEQVVANGELFLDEDFMMDIFLISYCLSHRSRNISTMSSRI